MLERYLTEPPNIQHRLALLIDHTKEKRYIALVRKLEQLGHKLEVDGPADPIHDDLMAELEAMKK
jgi:hypothetical protein